MIAYCPLDLPAIEVDEDLLELIVDHYDTGHHDKLWKAFPLIGKCDVFDNAEKFEKAWEKRYTSDGKIKINPIAEKHFPELIQHLLNLPMTVTHAQILSQVKDIPKHFDMKHKDGKFIDDHPENLINEPAGIKILLNCRNEKSFYICKSFDSDPIFIELPEDTNTFAINEKTFPHGAKMLNKRKFIVSVFGFFTDEKNKLIERSLKKYSSHAIVF